MKDQIAQTNKSATEHIVKMSGVTQTNCGCDKCVNMCKTAPCIGTPIEMEAILNAGFGDDLMPTTLVAPIVKATLGKPQITILGLRYDNEKQRCVMLSDDNKCKLHDLGIKPSEGKLADCKRTHAVKGKPTPLQIILIIWDEFNNVHKLN